MLGLAPIAGAPIAGASVLSGFAVAPTALPSNHQGPITCICIGAGTNWTGATTFSISGVSGWSKTGQSFGNSATFTVTIAGPGAAMPPSGPTGSLTFTDGATGTSVPVGTPAFSIIPSSATSVNTALTFTGLYTLWATDEPVFTTSLLGNTIQGDAWPANTLATATYSVALAGGIATIIDPSTGASLPFPVNLPTPVPIGVWTEPVRGIVWSEHARPIVWSGPTVLTLVKRLDEANVVYAYDFLYDAVISQGDAIASVTSVVATVWGPKGATLPSAVAPTYPGSGTRVYVTISGGQDDAIYLFEFKVLTVAGVTRVGLGKLKIDDDE